MKTILSIIFAVIFAANTFAQTAYQQKCNQIFVKYMKLIAASTGSKWGTAEEIALGQSGYSEAGATVIKPLLMVYCAKAGKSYEAMCQQVDAEYVAARKLMTADEKFAFKVNEESTVPYGKAKWQSALDFKEWSQKGEFETSEQHENRLKEQSRQTIDKFLYDNINKEISEDYWLVKFGDYNADKQELQILFYDNEKKYQIIRAINVSPQNAKYLKNHCSANSPELYVDGLIMHFGDDGMDDDGKMKQYWDEKGNLCYEVHDEVMTMKYDTYDICVIDKKIFVPRFFELSSEFGEWRFDISESVPPVKYNYDDWLGRPQQLKGYAFVYQEYAITIKEQIVEIQRQKEAEAARLAAQKAREDSAAIAGYNEQLNEQLKSFNQKLKDNKYNVKGLSVEKTFTIMTENNKTQFYNKMNELESAYKKIENEITRDYNSAKKEYGVFYNSDEDFDKFYCQGFEKFALETDFRNVMAQLQENKQNISVVNFLKEMNNNSVLNLMSDQPVDYTEINEYRRKLLEWVLGLKNKPYYEKVIDFLIINNAALNKEFSKNGAKFSSKAEFYDAFTGGNYKAVLKGKK